MNQTNKAHPREDQSLIALYHETCGEITRLRDYEWRIAYYFTSLSVGLIALLLTQTFQSLLTTSTRCLLTGFQIAAAGFTIYHLGTTHVYLTLQRNVRRSIEELFAFCDPGVFLEKAILPEKWKGKRISSNFQRMGLLVPLMVMVLLVDILCVIVIWGSH